MGRHSVAVDDDADDLQQTSGVRVAEAPGPPGRHASPDEVDEKTPVAPAALTASRPRPATDTESIAALPTKPIPPIAPAEANWQTVPIPPVEAVPPVEAPPEPQPSPTARDFALFREHPDVRNRAIAAVLAPFVGYAVVMVVIARTDVFLIWVWIPLILAGVLMGLILDLGHKRYATSGSADRP